MKNEIQQKLEALQTIFSQKGLNILYEAAMGREKELVDLMESEHNEILKAAIKIELEQVQSNKNIIREVLEETNDGECLSKESIFWNTFKSTAIINFKAASEAYNLLGNSVVGWPIFDDNDTEEIIKNTQQKMDTFGRIKIEPVIKEDYNKDQLEYLMEHGVKSCDILDIWKR